MDIPLDKVIPRVLAVAIVGYCLWPSYNVYFSKPMEKKAKEIPELTASLLSPEMPPSPGRDPFLSGSAAVASTLQNAPKTAVNVKSDKGRSKPAPTKTIADKKVVKYAVGSVRKDKLRPSRAENSKPMTLEATCIVNDRRLAVINGRLYAPDDKISVPEVSAAPCKIVNVLPYKVLLKCGEKKVELSFPNTSAKSNAAPRRTVKKKTTTTTKRKAPAKRRSAAKK